MQKYKTHISSAIYPRSYRNVIKNIVHCISQYWQIFIFLTSWEDSFWFFFFFLFFKDIVHYIPDSLVPAVIRASFEILLLCLHWSLHSNFFFFLSSKFTWSWIFASAYISFNTFFIFLFYLNFIIFNLL